MDFVTFKCLSFNHLGQRSHQTSFNSFVGSEKVLGLFLWSLSMKTEYSCSVNNTSRQGGTSGTFKKADILGTNT